jgi:hypothetical protein
MDRARQKQYQKSSKAPERSKPSQKKWKRLITIWADVEYLVTDEISLCSKRDLAYFSAAINYGKQVQGQTTIMGNLNTVYCGDFSQVT